MQREVTGRFRLDFGTGGTPLASQMQARAPKMTYRHVNSVPIGL
jgi:hypothetical protein